MSQESLGYVLIVEDELLIAMELVGVLELRGATVVGPVSRIRDAMVAIEKATRLDGAILDMNLRGELSLPVAEKLCANNVPFVFTTGYGEDNVPERFEHIPLLSKPIGAMEVVDKLAEIILATARADQSSDRHGRVTNC